MRRDAGRIAWDRADEGVAVADGADGIRTRIRSQGLPPDAAGSDFDHLAEDVHEARRAVYGDEDAAGKEWAGEVLHTVEPDGDQPSREARVSWRSRQSDRWKEYRQIDLKPTG